MMSSPTKGSFGCCIDPRAAPHTLILGTQPGDLSLQQQQYYNYHTNALWHICGDALGWRRGWVDGNGRGPPTSITRSLLHTRCVDSYEEAVLLLTARGYALWDVLRESEREGSLDGSIRKEHAADIRGLLQQYPTINTICLASGGTTAAFFRKHFKSWLAEPGAFAVAPDAASQQAFSKLVRGDVAAQPDSGAPDSGAIKLVVMESVSPAYVPRVSFTDEAVRRKAYAAAGRPELSARASAYAWKRQQWFDWCFQRELGDEEGAKRFGDRGGDFMPPGSHSGEGTSVEGDAPKTPAPPQTPKAVPQSGIPKAASPLAQAPTT